MRYPVIALVATALLALPAATSAQFECADCGWLPGAWCDYDPNGEFEDCTQCNYWYCCSAPPQEPPVCPLGGGEQQEEQIAVLLGADGSVLAPYEHYFILRNATETLRAGELVVRRACSGAILARRFEPQLVLRLKEETRHLAL